MLNLDKLKITLNTTSGSSSGAANLSVDESVKCPSQEFFNLIKQFALSLKEAINDNNIRAEQVYILYILYIIFVLLNM
jgi:hypothetical protein